MGGLSPIRKILWGLRREQLLSQVVKALEEKMDHGPGAPLSQSRSLPQRVKAGKLPVV